MHHPITLAVVVLFVMTAALLLVVNTVRGNEVQPLPVAEASELATTPASRLELKWWRERHKNKLAAKSKALEMGDEIELVFIGDSITHGWERAGKELWAERFAPYNALNLGYGGDRTEHVLWRLGLDAENPEGEDDAHNEILGLSPKLFVVMIGTNNTGHRMDPAEATAAGITHLIDLLQAESPDSHILLLGVFPRAAKADDPRRRLNAEINQHIAPLGERPSVTFLDISNAFLSDDGALPKSIMPDGLHPNKKGYQLWANAIRDAVAEKLGPVPTNE